MHMSDIEPMHTGAFSKTIWMKCIQACRPALILGLQVCVYQGSTTAAGNGFTNLEGHGRQSERCKMGTPNTCLSAKLASHSCSVSLDLSVTHALFIAALAADTHASEARLTGHEDQVCQSLYFWHDPQHLSSYLRPCLWIEALPLAQQRAGGQCIQPAGAAVACARLCLPYTWVPLGISAFRSTQTMPERM